MGVNDESGHGCRAPDIVHAQPSGRLWPVAISASFVFPEPLATVHIYDHCLMEARRVSENVAEGTMPIAPDICTPGGVRASLVGLLMELVNGPFSIELGVIVLSDMTLHMRDAALDVEAVRAEVTIVRRGRQRVIGVGRVHDVNDPSRLVAFGTTSIAVIGGADTVAPSIRTAQLPTTRAMDFAGTTVPDILTVMAMPIRDEDQACLLGRVHPGVVGPQGRVHGGAQQVMAEAAALAAAGRALGTDKILTADMSIRFVYPNLNGPFEAIPTVVTATDDDALCQVELFDHGNEGRLTSFTTCRVRRSA